VNHDLLFQALTSPDRLGNLTLREWDRLISEARHAGLLSRLGAILAEVDWRNNIPEMAYAHLQSARVTAENEERVMLWEVNRIQRALSMTGSAIVLLKGAAYAISGLPIARGRLTTDVDILVSKDQLHCVEEKLLGNGWQHVKLEEYDQYFYRTWSHELPPLVHTQRGTIVDVHHTILPPTGRLHPDPEKLFAGSRPLEGTKFRVLAPADMVLHSAAHAFQDGDLTRGLRDLVDIDDLLRHFGQKEEFWDELVSRAEQMDLFRPLYYALRYSNLYLQTPIPQRVLDHAKRWRPAWPASAIMDIIVNDVITAGPWGDDFRLKLSRQLLYMRSHWLRMPPWLLARHLLHKFIFRNKNTS
jgi:Uncharacterised nucleotidyltransferase